MKTQNTLFLKVALLSLTIAVVFTVNSAQAAEDWTLNFVNNLASFSDTFDAGVSSTALDGYDVASDLLQPAAPATSSYLEMTTLVDSSALTQDVRSYISVDTTEIWEITLAVGGDALTGTSEITWTALPDPLDEPGNEIPHFYDYGTDATRTTPVAIIDMRTQSSYSFSVSNVSGDYRYIDFQVQNVPEPTTLILLGFGSVILRKRK